MKRISIVFFVLVALAASLFGQGPGRIAVVAMTNGPLQTPTNFFYSNIFQGTNIIIQPTNGGAIWIHSTASGTGGGTVSGTNAFAVLSYQTNFTFGISTAAVYHTVTGYFASSAVNCSVNASAGSITNTHANWYLIHLSSSFSGSGGVGDIFEMGVFTNNIETPNIEWIRKTASTDSGSAAGHGILYLPAGTRIDSRIQNTAATGDIGLRKHVLSVVALTPGEGVSTGTNFNGIYVTNTIFGTNQMFVTSSNTPNGIMTWSWFTNLAGVFGGTYLTYATNAVTSVGIDGTLIQLPDGAAATNINFVSGTNILLRGTNNAGVISLQINTGSDSTNFNSIRVTNFIRGTNYDFYTSTNIPNGIMTWEWWTNKSWSIAGETNYNGEASVTNASRIGLVHGKTGRTNTLRSIQAGNGMTLVNQSTNIVLNMSATLDDLSDVYIDVAAADGDVLTYNQAYSIWTNMPPSTGSGGTLTNEWATNITRTIFVAPAGSDSWPGTMLFPKASLSNAVHTAVDNSRIYLYPGIYTNYVNAHGRLVGRTNCPVNIYQRTNLFIDARGAQIYWPTGASTGISIGKSKGILIQGLELKGYRGDPAPPPAWASNYISSSGGIFGMVELWNSEEITLDGMRVSDFYNHGILCDVDDGVVDEWSTFPCTNGIVVKNCEIENGSILWASVGILNTFDGSGIVVSGGGHVINNTVKNCSSGIEVYPLAGGAYTGYPMALIEGNTIENARSAGINIQGCPVQVIGNRVSYVNTNNYWTNAVWATHCGIWLQTSHDGMMVGNSFKGYLYGAIIENATNVTVANNFMGNADYVLLQFGQSVRFVGNSLKGISTGFKLQDLRDSDVSGNVMYHVGTNMFFGSMTTAGTISNVTLSGNILRNDANVNFWGIWCYPGATLDRFRLLDNTGFTGFSGSYYMDTNSVWEYRELPGILMDTLIVGAETNVQLRGSLGPVGLALGGTLYASNGAALLTSSTVGQLWTATNTAGKGMWSNAPTFTASTTNALSAIWTNGVAVTSTATNLQFLAGANMTIVGSNNPAGLATIILTASAGAGDAGGTNARAMGVASLTNLGQLSSFVFTNVPLGGTNISVRTAGGTNFIDTTGYLNNWSLYPTSIVVGAAGTTNFNTASFNSIEVSNVLSVLGTQSVATLEVGTLTLTNPISSAFVTNGTASTLAVWGADWRATNLANPTGTKILYYTNSVFEWHTAPTGGTGTPEGPSGSVQFSEGTSLAGTNRLRYDRTNDILYASNIVANSISTPTFNVSTLNANALNATNTTFGNSNWFAGHAWVQTNLWVSNAIYVGGTNLHALAATAGDPSAVTNSEGTAVFGFVKATNVLATNIWGGAVFSGGTNLHTLAASTAFDSMTANTLEVSNQVTLANGAGGGISWWIKQFGSTLGITNSDLHALIIANDTISFSNSATAGSGPNVLFTGTQVTNAASGVTNNSILRTNKLTSVDANIVVRQDGSGGVTLSNAMVSSGTLTISNTSVNITNAMAALDLQAGTGITLASTNLGGGAVAIKISSTATGGGSEIIFINTAAAAQTYGLDLATNNVLLVKTNAAFDLTITNLTSTNIIAGDGIWVEARTLGTTWIMRW